MIETNIIHASYINKVEKLLFLGSSCIYPKLAPQPIKEEYLLTGLLEKTNEAYAIAEKRPLMIEEFDLPSNDMSAASLTQRIVVKILKFRVN